MRRVNETGKAAGTCFRPGWGFTLVELLVVLLLLALTFALVTPSLFRSGSDPEDPVQRVIDEARRLAVKRAETLTLAFASDGHWVMESGRADAADVVSDGMTEWPYAGPARIRISAIGACLLEAQHIPDARFDPVQCRLATPGSIR